MTTTNKKMIGLFVAMLIGAALAPLGCKDVPAGDIGDVTLAISLPDGSEIHAVDWVLHAGGGAVVEMGTINTTNGKVKASLATVVPTGTGYTITMSGMTTAGTSCTGTSSPFTVSAGQTAQVQVNIVCGSVSTDAGTGTVVVQSTVVPGDSCPILTSSLIAPQQTSLADPISVTAAGSDSDMGDTLTFAWTATAGTFTSASSATTQYHCPSTVGTQTLTLRISDDHMPTPCTTVITFPAVDCQ